MSIVSNSLVEEPNCGSLLSLPTAEQFTNTESNLSSSSNRTRTDPDQVTPHPLYLGYYLVSSCLANFFSLSTASFSSAVEAYGFGDQTEWEGGRGGDRRPMTKVNGLATKEVGTLPEGISQVSLAAARQQLL
jgi:hypothetical protein